MFYQIIGKDDPRKGCYEREVLLGCVRIDEPNLVKSVDQSRFAFHAFVNHEKNSYSCSNCTVRGMFLVVTGFYPHMPETEKENRDVLFLYQVQESRSRTVWKFLKPGHNGFSDTGTVVHGSVALDRLIREIERAEQFK